MSKTQLQQRTDDQTATADQDCPECDGRVLQEAEERVCEECGLVVEENRLQQGGTWRPWDDERRPTASTELKHDRNLGSTIWGDVDAYGNDLESSKRTRFYRQRRLHTRSRFESKAERNLAKGIGEVQRMAGALGVGKDQQSQACRLFRHAQDGDHLRGHSIEGVASALLYAVCRINDLPILRSDVARVARVDRSRIDATYRTLNRDMGLPTPPPRPKLFVPSIVSDLGLSEDVRRRAGELLDALPDDPSESGCRPHGVAAAAVYVAAVGRTQNEIADVAGVSTVTLRRHVDDLEEVSVDG